MNISDAAREAYRLLQRTPSMSMPEAIQHGINTATAALTLELETRNKELNKAWVKQGDLTETIERIKDVEGGLREELETVKQERDELAAQLLALGEFAVSDWQDEVVGRVDALVKDPARYKDRLRALFVEIPAERDQLRQQLAEAREMPCDCKLVAHDTGDGWSLNVENEEGRIIADIKWPDHWEAKSGDDLRKMGYEIV